MQQGKWMWAAVVAVVGGVCLSGVGTEAAPTSQPATTRPARAFHRKLTKPWSEMQTLTPKQQEQIEKVHGDAILQEKQIHAKEHDDIVALLTPEQQTELTDMEAKDKVTLKERNATGRKRKSDATTQPLKK